MLHFASIMLTGQHAQKEIWGGAPHKRCPCSSVCTNVGLTAHGSVADLIAHANGTQGFSMMQGRAQGLG